MSLQDFYSSLVEYNNKLKEISIDNIDYNALNSAVLIFFEEINALDKNFLEYYFLNITKENVKKNLVQEYAFNYFILLTIKNIKFQKLFNFIPLKIARSLDLLFLITLSIFIYCVYFSFLILKFVIKSTLYSY